MTAETGEEGPSSRRRCAHGEQLMRVLSEREKLGEKQRKKEGGRGGPGRGGPTRSRRRRRGRFIIRLLPCTAAAFLVLVLVLVPLSTAYSTLRGPAVPCVSKERRAQITPSWENDSSFACVRSPFFTLVCDAAVPSAPLAQLHCAQQHVSVLRHDARDRGPCGGPYFAFDFD